MIKRILLLLLTVVSAYAVVDAMPPAMVPQMQYNGKYGYVDSLTGRLAIKAKYDNAQMFHEGLAAVEIDGHWGFINEQGRMVVKCIYDNVRDFYRGYALVMDKGFWGAINQQGNVVIPLQYVSPEEILELKVFYINETQRQNLENIKK